MNNSQSTDRKKCGENLSCLGLFYDILGQLISVLDVTTDIIVCIQYYQNDRMVFFGISLTILILALICYDIAFVNKIESENLQNVILMFLVVLPISPFVPYLLYFTADDTSMVSNWLRKICCFSIYLEHRPGTRHNISKLRNFMKQKVQKHLGFIIEAVVEGIKSLCIMYSCFSYLYPCTIQIPCTYIIYSISSSNSADGSNCHL